MDYIQEIRLDALGKGKLFTPAVIGILIALSIGYILSSTLASFCENWLALTQTNILHAKIWTILTYPFVFNCVWNTIFGAFAILFIGSAVEKKWGTTSFLILSAVIVITCAILRLIIDLITTPVLLGNGINVFIFGYIAMFGLIYRRQKILFFYFELEAQLLAILLIAVGVIINIPTKYGLIWVLAAGVAYVYSKLRFKLIEQSARTPKINKQNNRSNGFVDID